MSTRIDRFPTAIDQGVLLDGGVRYRSSDRTRLSGPEPDRLEAHRRRYGERPPADGPAGTELLAALERVALTGRGGAHFPTAIKWRSVLAAGGQGTVIANAAEGEPASAKDAALLQQRPHLVLDGLACTAEAVAATGSVVWLHEGATETHRAVRRALDERRAAGLIEPTVRLATGPDRYLTGQSSAVIRGLTDGVVLPTFRRAPRGSTVPGGRPDLVQNVETLARVGLIARTGGYGPEPGPLVTMLTTAGLTVCELPPWTTVAEAEWLTRAPWRETPTPQSVLIGGYGGSWLNWSEAAELTLGHLDRRRTRNPDSQAHRRRRLTAVTSDLPSLGAGVIAPLPSDVCGLTETAAALDYLARSSARQCGPCLFGTRALADGMTRIAQGTAHRREVERILRLTGEVDGRGACGLPDGAAALTRSALRVFAVDLERHLRHRSCLHPAGRVVLPIPQADR